MQKQIFILLCMLCIGVHAQDVITKEVEDFNELKVFDKIAVTLVEAEENKIEITGIKRKEVNVVQKGTLLKIRMSLNNLWDGNDNTSVTVYYTKLSKIDVNEGAKVKAKGVIKSKNLDLRAQEGATIIAKIEAEFVFSKAITGGSIDVKGEAKEQEVVITSGGHFYGGNLRTQDTQVKISAGGAADVNAKNYLKANTNAGGTIRIFGNPKEIDTQKLLGGKIIEVN